ncbi:MAG: nucleotide exchange factor GrpE [Gammaproteobacteria bacterium]|nr:nucleotide exchange factor GrpE [Gammaproteobacteria bacterium]
MINKQNIDGPEVSAEAADDNSTATSDNQNADASPEALAAMEAKADEHWQRYLRTAAELENVRKRAVRDVEHAHRFGLEKFAGDVLGVRDSMALGLEAAKENGTVESLQEGGEMTLKLLDQVLSRHGVTEINPLGERFDPELHEAMAVIEAPDAEPDSVVTVVQPGFAINGRLLRAARVIVARSAS